ncbi:MAG: thymidine phosphorylase [Firmicutes bacterium ML8_F2]|jgi:pyrimidine-nucleoside phosphorylase|nr:MAG: thymidine phosphorylase [Firmicutes bacterium ML8_F2]
MQAGDLIFKKRSGETLTKNEVDQLITGYVRGDIPDYQMSALLMAIFFQGMNEEETLDLTNALVNSGETIDLSDIPGFIVDKHSTGGVGDTTTLILAPLVASAGVPVAKLSGRSLGHTGGTLDKLESIPGLRTEMTVGELIAAVKKIGVAIAGQTGKLVPADKMLYALRDVTATVDSIPLIAASIMSKKLAAGADGFVLDVKIGDGAFIKRQEEGFTLARLMAAIGQGAGRRTAVVVTAMEQPLGRAVGNALEVEEAILTLRGEGPPDLEKLCLELGSRMLSMAGAADNIDGGKVVLDRALRSGAALQKFAELIENQRGDGQVIEDLSLLPRAEKTIAVRAVNEGYVYRLKAENIGRAVALLGAGRWKKSDPVDPAVGITVNKKIGDRAEKGETLALIHARDNTSAGVIDEVEKLIRSACMLVETPVEKPALICGYVG